MSYKAIAGVCPNCGKEALIIAAQFRDHTDWQMKYGIECEHCGYRFKVDKKSIDNVRTLLKTKKKT